MSASKHSGGIARASALLLPILPMMVGVTSCSSFAQLSQPSEPPVVRIYMIGDSTMADKPVTDNPERGWGQMLPQFFEPNVVIRNHARNGRSTKSFLDEGLWQKVFDQLQPGDYVIIQFGHNDSKKEDPLRYAEPFTTYKTNLERYVNETRSKGAIPILATPVNRRRFDKDGKFVDSHGDYPPVCRQVAQEMSVPLLEIQKLSEALIVRHGDEGSKRLFMWIEPGLYDKRPEGKEDNTHFNPYGATRVAELAVEEIRRLNLPLAQYLKE